jgi:hypothetical protein
MQDESYPRASFSRRASALGLALLLAMQAGCASDHATADTAPASPVADFRPGMNLGTVAVVAVAELPDTLFGTHPAKPRTESALGTCGDMLRPNTSTKDTCTGPCALGMVGEMVVALAVCGTLEFIALTAGAKHGQDGVAPPPVPGKPATPATLNALVVQEALRDYIVASAKARDAKLAARQPESVPRAQAERSYRALVPKGVDTVLEVELTQVLAGAGYDTDSAAETNPSLPLEMKAHVRLFRAGDSALLYQHDYVYRGERLRYDEWTAHHGQQLLNEVRRGYEELAHAISDSIFLPPADAGRAVCDGQVCNLAPWRR